MTEYLTLPELLGLAKRLGTPDVRDYGLLDSALVYLHLNGHPLDAAFHVDRAERFVLAVCQGELDVPAIAAALPSFAATP
ncbi:hypothetical protein AB0H71_14185 [Nocardia sp. NPDC050697]|uniref:hypothetical protein n=1 Tax=Nocardia sp. NPDC050697 TaxID=3155158 RepID=UPI0033D6FBA8